ncbi:MAG: phosphate ABC transporter substrate-binding protein [Endomicrobium sp.]|jgi:phosphate transport system substrate-binding protein|nr:phosphate ABC transporter substrate-binding protein [Endomicrobium sp.]
MGIMNFFKPILCTLFFLLCVSINACTQNKQVNTDVSIKIKGSDTIVNLVQMWTEQFIEKNPSFNINITGGGSGAGFAALINKTCDIVMSSRPIADKECKLAKYNNILPVGFEIGRDGLAVIVNKNNIIDKLTIEEVKDIFTGKISNWKSFGWEDREIVVLSRESNSGTYTFFKNKIIRHNNKSEDEFSTNVLMMPSSQSVYNEVCQNPNAIGYVGMGFVNNNVKVISIATDIHSQYIAPIPLNVMNNKYPISRPLYFYIDYKRDSAVNKFISYVLSEVSQKNIIKAGFIPAKLNIKT